MARMTTIAVGFILGLAISASCSHAGNGGIGGSIFYRGGPPPGSGDRRQPGEVVIYDENGSEVARQSVQEGDGFGFTLRAGSYRLVTTSGDASCKDIQFTLTEGQYVDTIVYCDIM